MSLIDDHLAQLRSVPRIMFGFGEPFYFMQSRVLEIPTGVKVRTLREFRDALTTIDTGAVYLHLVEARGRKGRRRSDFAAWVDEHLKLPELAARMGRLNPFQQSLEDIRRRLVALADEALGQA